MRTSVLAATNLRTRMRLALTSIALAAFCACGPPADLAPKDAAPAAHPEFTESLLLHASFTRTADADFAKGDARIFTVDSFKNLPQARPGIEGEGVLRQVAGEEFGSALRFTRRDHPQVFYRAKDNTAFSPGGWNGTISFWLRVDPAVDLAPGFTDPIQITDSAYDDTCIWVDFTKDNPRDFRLGVFGDRESWNPENTETSKNPAFEQRLIPVKNPPFRAQSWTHVAITHEALGTPAGRTALYLNGQKQGEKTGIADKFEWRMEDATIRLGVNFIGWFDELSIFSRPFSDEEVKRLYMMRAAFRPDLESR